MRLPSVILLGCLGLASAGCGAGENAAVLSGSDERYIDPAGWSLTYPAGMQLERSRGLLRISVSEVTAASFPAQEAVHVETSADSGSLHVDPPRDSEGRFAADGVAFRLLAMEGGPAPALDLPESRFPIRLKDFRRSSAYAGTEPRPLERLVVANGRRYLAYAWIGEAATDARRAELARVVSSLSFPRLRPGSTVGYGFRVLGRSDRYPPGSFTRITSAARPLYVVHAPGGFYAIGWSGVSASDGYRSRCRLRLDRPRREFFCANLRARWDRVGRVIRRPAEARAGEPLRLSFAKVAWDGHVLLHPGDGLHANRSVARRFWPGWR